MKHLKILGLALVTAAALMAIVGAGSAFAGTRLCTSTPCVTDYPAGTAIKASLSGSAIFETTGSVLLDTCTGGEINASTSTTEGEPLTAAISALTWTGCTKTTDTTVQGELTITTENASANGNGSLSGDNSSWTINGIFNTSCVYGTAAGTRLGTITGGSPASINISARLPRTVANSLCPAEILWTASYTVTSPNPLFVS